jgi:thiol-disulfide isomerase/thioredoxin/uncharacterized membrane protein YphA (DoxX/SURF4 family)
VRGYTQPESWGPGLRPLLDVAGRLVLGGVLLSAGILKALDSSGAVAAVDNYDLVPGLLVQPVALGLILLEIALGGLLLCGLFTRFAAAGGGALAVVFLGALVQAKARGLQIGCGCFGGSGAGEGVTWLDLLRAFGLLVAAVYLLFSPTAGRFGLDRWLRGRGSATEFQVGLPLVMMVLIVLAAVAVPFLTGVPSYAYGAPPDQVHVAGSARDAPIPPGGRVPDFSAPSLEGKPLAFSAQQGVPTVIVVWNPRCPFCRQELPVLVRLVSEFPGVRLLGIVSGRLRPSDPSPAEFLESLGLTLPVMLDTADQRLAEALGVRGYPTVYYLRADATVSVVQEEAVAESRIRSSLETLAR